MEKRWILRTTAIEDMFYARKLGFDDIEPDLVKIMQYDMKDISRFIEIAADFNFNCEVFESPLPKEIIVTERGFNIFSWIEYLKLALDRSANLGCKTLVWAGGKARILPQEGDTSVPREHFSQFLFMLCDVASKYEISICIEPASPLITNFLTSPKEVAEIIASVNQPNLAMLLSSAYIAQSNSDFEMLKYNTPLLRHVHLESSTSYHVPLAPTLEESFDYKNFIYNLKKFCNYSGPFALPAHVDERFFSFLRTL